MSAISITHYALKALTDIPKWVHPSVSASWETWKLLRDSAEGEIAIKIERQTYLPQSEGMDDDEYQAFLQRASYYNFTGRTIGAMNGTLFRRRPVLSNMPERFTERLKSVSADSEPLLTYAETVGKEIIHMGRVGVLLDLPATPSTEPKPYFTSYTAENILDWETTKVDGKDVLIYVVLREFESSSSRDLVNGTVAEADEARRTRVRYRTLHLTDGVYYQYVFSNPDGKGNAELTAAHRSPPIVPERQGKSLNFIPFLVFGPEKNTPEVAKSPVLDIAQTNISHYNSYAELEQNLYYTFPVYYAEMGQGQQGGGDYHLAPNRVWEVPSGSKPGLLEFNGQGLKFLENALDRKEQHASSLGGRMIGIRTAAVSESDNTVRMKELNEHSTLLGVSKSLDMGFTKLAQWWAWWAGASDTDVKKIAMEFNKDFVFDGIGSREFRAIHAMYLDGVLPVEVVYDYLKKALVIPDWMSFDEFKKLLDKMESFPNQPDAEARKDGFPDKQSQLDNEQADEDRKSAEKQAEAARKAAAANPAPSGPNAPGNPGRPPAGGPAKTNLE